jgi:hypothetical protein
LKIEVEDKEVQSIGNLLAKIKNAKFDITGGEVLSLYQDISGVYLFYNRLKNANVNDINKAELKEEKQD